MTREEFVAMVAKEAIIKSWPHITSCELMACLDLAVGLADELEQRREAPWTVEIVRDQAKNGGMIGRRKAYP